MSTITTILGTDLPSNSRSDINTNFANLNSDKIETSVIDTDTALSANSDSKIPSQKAVKTYIDTSGGANASTTVRGIVEEAIQTELADGTATGGTGARLFINPSLTAETSAGSSDEGKLPRLNASGKLDASFLALSIASGATTKDCSTTTTTTIAHGLGTTPTFVYVDVKGHGSTEIYVATAVYSSSTQSSNSAYSDTGSGTAESSSAAFDLDVGGSGILTGTITVNATNISIAWSGTTFSSTAYIIWYAIK